MRESPHHSLNTVTLLVLEVQVQELTKSSINGTGEYIRLILSPTTAIENDSSSVSEVEKWASYFITAHTYV